MKRRIKSVLGMILVLCIVMGMQTTTYAADNTSGLRAEVDGSLLTDDSFSESVLYNRTKGNILNTGAARISEIGSGKINAYGAIMAAVKCDTLRLEINVQRLEGSTWVNVKHYSTSASNTSLLTKSYNCSVAKGYYYRVMAGCIATKGGTTETQIPVTNGIWID